MSQLSQGCGSFLRLMTAISASLVKLVELSQSEQRFEVEALAIEPLPKGTMEDRNPSDLDGLAAAIRRGHEILGSRFRKAAVAVPPSNLINLFPCLQNSSDVLLVASRQEDVDLRRDMLQDASPKAAIVDVEAYVMENTLPLLAQGFFKKETTI
jgi:type IV pilus assembly protein PilM